MPEYGSHEWDLTAPSYLRTLTTRSKAKVEPGFVIADVMLNEGILADKRITEAEIDRWLGTTVPRIYEWIRSESRFRGSRIGFEFWTTGEFSSDARRLLVERSSSTRKCVIGWREGTQVEEYVQQTRNRRLMEVIREQY
jgi:hypothetical protein